MQKIVSLGAPFGVGIILGLISWVLLYNYHTINGIDDVWGMVIAWWVIMLLYSAFEFMTDGWRGLKCVFAMWPLYVWAVVMFGVNSVGWPIALYLFLGCVFVILVSLSLAKTLKMM